MANSRRILILGGGFGGVATAGVFAHAEGEVVARNIARAMTGAGTQASFDGHGERFIEVGGGEAGFGRGDF